MALGATAATGANAVWQARSRAQVWHPCTQMQRTEQVPPLPIASGQGLWLTDYEGNRYLDATSSWWVNLFGHADAGINAAVKHQLDTLPHVMLAGCTHAPAVELAERLSALTGGVLGHCFFASDGASAVEIALKMSFHHWRNAGLGDKREFVCLRQGYHGETLGALAVTDVTVFRDAYDPLLMRAHMVPSPDARQAQPGETSADVARRAAQALGDVLAARSGHIAAVVLEPLVQCAAGMAMHHPLYLRLVRQLCDTHQVHLIADEIAVGCGRTGSFFAFEQASTCAEDGTTTAYQPASPCQPDPPLIWPDLLCLSKGISGGLLPLSLVLSRDAIYQGFLSDDIARGFLHSHSYTGNPLACSAAVAVLKRFDEHRVLDANRQQSQWLSQALAPLGADPRLEHARQLGMIWAVDVKTVHTPAQFAERLHMAARQHGLLLRPIGRTVYVMPPYLITPDIAHWLAERLARCLHDVLPTHPQQPATPYVDRPPEPTIA